MENGLPARASATARRPNGNTAASVAALTLYDMLKAHGKGMVIEQVRLLSKTGGKSGAWRADVGQGDVGQGEVGQEDVGQGEVGQEDVGQGEVGQEDVGQEDVGQGDVA